MPVWGLLELAEKQKSSHAAFPAILPPKYGNMIMSLPTHMWPKISLEIFWQGNRSEEMTEKHNYSNKRNPK